jgi:uncharacterized membrane protein
MLPKEDVIPMQMSISDGMKTIISGGAVTPHFENLDNGQETTNCLSCSNDSAANQSSPAQSE